MVSKSETGHAINVANFNDLISHVKGLKTAYNPSNPALTLDALQTLSGTAETALKEVNTSIGVCNTAVAAREVAFDPLSKLVTRIMNMLKVSGVSQQVYDSVNTVARKIKGQRASVKVVPTPDNEKNGETSETRQVSTSQMSYDSREENFDKLIQLLTAIPEYAPNETDLQLVTLSELNTSLKQNNEAVINADVNVSNARIHRNDVLYKPTSGLCDIALSVKNYVKAVFGATSPQYKQISKLRFSRNK